MKASFMRGLAAALLLAGTSAHAVSLGFSPSAQSAPVGSSVDVDLVISGLRNGGAPSLSVFNLDVLYDSAILGLTNVAFGDPDPLVGDQLDLFGSGSNPTVVSSVAGGTRINEESQNTRGDLNDFQLDSFTLARLTFDVLALGTSPLDLAIVTLGDADGAPLEATVDPGRVTGVPTGVPEPGTLTLFLVGSAVLGVAWRRTAA